MKDSAAEGGLGVKHSELIALGIGIAVRCKAWMYTHVEKCLKAGTTPREVMDTACVAVVMGGGPVYTYTTILPACSSILPITQSCPELQPSHFAFFWYNSTADSRSSVHVQLQECRNR